MMGKQSKKKDDMRRRVVSASSEGAVSVSPSQSSNSRSSTPTESGGESRSSSSASSSPQQQRRSGSANSGSGNSSGGGRSGRRMSLESVEEEGGGGGGGGGAFGADDARPKKRWSLFGRDKKSSGGHRHASDREAPASPPPSSAPLPRIVTQQQPPRSTSTTSSSSSSTSLSTMASSNNGRMSREGSETVLEGGSSISTSTTSDSLDTPTGSSSPSISTIHSESSESFVDTSPGASRRTIRDRVRSRRFLFASFRSRSKVDIPSQEALLSQAELEEISASVMNPLVLLEMIVYNKDAITNPLFESEQQQNQAGGLKPEQSEMSISSMDSSSDTPLVLADWKKSHLPPAAAAFYPPQYWVSNVMTEITTKLHSPSEWSLEDREVSARYVQTVCDSIQRRIAIENGIYEQLQAASQTNSDEYLLQLIEQWIQQQRPHVERIDSNLSRLQDLLQQILSTRTFTRVVERDNAKLSETVELNEKGNPERIVVDDRGLQEVYVVAGTAKVLVRMMLDAATGKEQDATTLKTLLATFRLFFKPISLLGHFDDILDAAIPKRDHDTMVRMDTLLKYWTETCWRMDFVTNGLVDKVKKLTEKLVTGLDNMGLSFAPKTDPAYLAITLADAEGVDKTEPLRPPPKPVSDFGQSDTSQFMDMTESIETFCSGLANHEFSMFREITLFHLMEKLFSKSNDKVGPLMSLINWSNQISYWIGSNICITYDLKKRVKVLSRFIDLAKCCCDIQAYNTAFAIITALQGSSLMRLQKTWAGLSRRSITLFDDLEQFCSPQNNYKAYRSQLPLPRATYIPYMGVHLRDLVYLNDGTPSKLPNGLYNFEKYRKMSRNINHLLGYQNQFYHTSGQNDKIVKYIKEIEAIRTMEDRHLYKLSCLCETPNWRKKKIVVVRNTTLDPELVME